LLALLKTGLLNFDLLARPGGGFDARFVTWRGLPLEARQVTLRLVFNEGRALRLGLRLLLNRSRG